MNLIFGLILPLSLVIAESQSTDLPITFRTCPRHMVNYTECMSNAITDAILSISHGSKVLKIQPFDEYKIRKISNVTVVDQFHLTQIIKNMEIYGLTDGLSTECEYIDRDLRTLRFSTFSTHMDFVCDYEAIGYYPSRPEFQKAAHLAIMTTNPQTEHIIQCERYESNGTEFLKVVKYKVRTAIDTISYEFADDFGVPIMEFNNVADDEWAALFGGITRKLELKMASFYKSMANKIFSRFPLNVLFPN